MFWLLSDLSFAFAIQIFIKVLFHLFLKPRSLRFAFYICRISAVYLWLLVLYFAAAYYWLSYDNFLASCMNLLCQSVAADLPCDGTRAWQSISWITHCLIFLPDVWDFIFSMLHIAVDCPHCPAFYVWYSHSIAAQDALAATGLSYFAVLSATDYYFFVQNFVCLYKVNI